MRQFPSSTVTTAEVAIAALSAEEAVTDESADLHRLWLRLATAAAEAAEAADPDWPKVKALWLVAEACSRRLQGDSTNEPFAPMMQFVGEQSTAPGGFGIDDAKVLSDVAAAVTHRHLRARLADLAWLADKPKKIADAHRAIDAYTQVLPTEQDRYLTLHGWRRAITLCLQLGKGAGDRLDRIEAQLMALAEAAIPLDGFLGLAVARLLFDRQLGRDHGATIPDLLATQGEKLIAAGNHLGGRNYLGLASEWYAKLGIAERAADMTLAMALSWEAEADQRISMDRTSGHLVAGEFFESGIQTLRKIPRGMRPSRDVDVHAARLQRRLTDSGTRSIDAMQTFSTGLVDITPFVQQAEAAVTGKPALHALLQLVHLHAGMDVARLTEQAHQMMQQFPLMAMMGAAHYGPDGRVIARTPGGGIGEPEAGDPRVFATMMRHYLIDVDLICEGLVLPAVAVIKREHIITKADLAAILAQSPIIPPGRIEQFSKALWEGFEYDFATATYLLAPQVEHLVRWHLKQLGVQTTTLGKDGIENEVGLSTLIDEVEVEAILGDGDAFELRALFCSALGPNLRNQVAHGLLNQAECNTSVAAYAWWWVLRLALRSVLRSLRSQNEPVVEPAGLGESQAAT